MEESMLLLLEEFAKYEPYLKEHYENANKGTEGISGSVQTKQPRLTLVTDSV